MSNLLIGAVLEQRKNKTFHIIYYASRTLNGTQLNHATTKKGSFAVIFAIDKFCSYLLGTKVLGPLGVQVSSDEERL